VRRILALASILLSETALLAAAPCDEGLRLFDTRRFAEARKALEPCAASDSLASLYSGRAWFADRELDRAVAAFQKAIALDPKSSDAQLWLGRAYAQKAASANVFTQASLAKKIHVAFEKAVALDPASADARLAMVDFYLLAPGIMGGSLEKARGEAAEIRRRDPLRGFQAFGKIAEHEKKYDAAEAEYENAAKEFPSRKEPYLWREELASRRNQNARAFEILESLRRALPADPTVDFAVGRLGAQTGDRLEHAEECLKRYLAHRPERDEPALSAAHYQLGVLYEKKGDHALARSEWRQALALEPEHFGAKEALAKK